MHTAGLGWSQSQRSAAIIYTTSATAQQKAAPAAAAAGAAAAAAAAKVRRGSVCFTMADSIHPPHKMPCQQANELPIRQPGINEGMPAQTWYCY
jgi:hypothetical protein